MVLVLAMAAGVLLLGELVTVKFILACGLVLGGIAISLGLHRSLRLT